MNLISGVASRFRDLPIRRKLRIIFLLTTGTALLLAGLAIVAADSFLFYNYLRRDLATFVRIIGDNSTGALAFDDVKAANETLASLRARSHVEIACLYQRTGALLATYKRPDYEGSCPAAQAAQVRYDRGKLVASQQVRLDAEPVGALVVQYDLDEILERIGLYGATVLGALLLSAVFTILLSARLRALIAEPILELAGIANSVSLSKDYRIRATKHSQDELGMLAEALNQMMEAIQSRDSELRTALADQRDALERLAELNADLQRSNTDLERFAFMASHDLQEPLRMITSYSQLLVAEVAANQQRPSELVNYIVGGTKRMRELLADLLAYTEIAGSVEQPPTEVDLNDVLLKVEQSLGVRIEETHAEISSVHLPVVSAHASRMSSLFQNLIENAIKYRSQASPRIQIQFEDDREQFRFAVVDNGIGIDKEYHDKIFVAFQRLHGKEVPGTGVGLAICQRVVERYGGRIWVESEAGEGSTFRFTLPKSMAVNHDH